MLNRILQEPRPAVLAREKWAEAVSVVARQRKQLAASTAWVGFQVFTCLVAVLPQL